MTKTWDPITDNEISQLSKLIRNDVIGFINEVYRTLGIKLRIPKGTGGYRPNELQAALYGQGRTLPGDIITNAKPGFSWHNYGLAFDVAPIEGNSVNYNLITPEVVKIAESYGFEWGGYWKSKDTPHFQKTFGKSITDMLNKKHGLELFVIVFVLLALIDILK